MKRTVAVGIIAVLACALFLVPYASAAKLTIIDTWVEGPSGEVLDEYTYVDVNGDCTYKVKVGIEGRYSMRPVHITANLAFGPNHGNRNCKDSRTEKGEIGEGESTTTITIADISLSSLDYCDDAFKEFVDGKGGWKWDTCWYQFDVESMMVREGAQTGIKRGIPVLKNAEVIYYNSHVEQNRVYKDLSFDYQVKVWANCEDSIALQVCNYTSGGWDKHGLQNYTKPLYTNKTLTWLAVNLTPDNFDSEGQGQYTFVANISKSRPEKPYSGPIIEERFKDPKESYKKTINELLLFDYEVSVEIDQIRDSIMLEVYNYSLRDWEQKGIRNYTTPGKYQKLIWESIILSLSSDYFDDNLRGKYRFVGKYKTSEIIGPRIEEKFHDLLVTPTQGKNNVTFNYSVTVNANISDKIVLQVKNHTNNGWYSKGTRDYTTPNINETLTWHNIQLNTHELNRHNDSIFRFVGMCDAKSSEKGLPIWPINPVFENLSVKQERGLYSENYNYSVDVKAEKNGIVNLSIFCPDGILLCETPQDYDKAPEWQTLNWSVQKFNECVVKTGDAGFRFEFWYERNEIINRTKEGPYIGIAKFENESVEPKIGTEGTLFNYTINVTAAHRGDVVLLTKCPGGTQWATKNEKEYDTPKITKTLKWTRIELPCDICGNAEYKFRFIQGDVPSEIYPGPELIIEEFGALIVDREEGTNYTPFNFSIDFTTSKPRNVTLWARYDEGEWELEESKPVASKRETILFSNITPRKAFKKIAWKCKGIANESGITYTLWDIDLKWLNESIGRSPEKGWWNDTYNFSVTLSANAKGNVELKVKQDSTNEWKSVGNMSYTDQPNQQTLSWADEQICNDPYEGNTSYNFTFHWENVNYSTPSYQGPGLYIPACIIIASCNVIPANGIGYTENNVLQDYFKNMNIPRFNYSINVSAAKDVRIKLVTTDCVGEETEHEEKRNHAPGSKTLTWPVKSSDFDRIGLWNYTFAYYDTRWSRWQDCSAEKCGEGPELIAILKEFTIDPTPPFRVYGESYNVSAVVNGSRDLDITLELCTNASCEPVGTGIYESSEEEREMIWTDIKPWDHFGSDEELKFNVNVTWGDGDV